MGISYISVSVVCTVGSFLGLAVIIYILRIHHALDLLLGSNVIIALLVNFVINLYVLLILCLKLHPTETRKVVERGAFLPLIVPPTVSQAALWSTWLTVLCTLKRPSERLNASPSATPWTYFVSFCSAAGTILPMLRLCIIIYKSLGSTMFLLLFFEPLSIAFETVQAVMVHGFQLLDMWQRHSVESNTDCQSSLLFSRSVAGICVLYWNGRAFLFELCFILDIMTWLMALGHYLHIWIKGFVKLRLALSSLHGALPDATSEEVGLEPNWGQPWPNQGSDGAGPSSTAVRSVGLGRVQMMMRHLASVGETYAQTAIEDAAWGLWPTPHPQAASGSSILPPQAAAALGYNGHIGGLRFRNPTHSVNDNMSAILAMAETVREDLQRTNSVAVTVNNLLQM
ncbi:hypothetical protein MKW92_023563 [Papaver armeniacum]|nr:hypothetical protein MKW92_023563 [Papaver armeniacum]